MNFNTAIVLLILAFIWIPWLWRYHIRPYFEKNELAKRIKNHPDKKRILATERLLTTLFKNVNSTKVSQKERKRLGIDEDAFVYGEIQFLPFFTMLDKVKPQAGEVFYDLGSGAGKAVFTAALNFDLAKACGVELLPGLLDIANAQIQRARQLLTAQKDNFKNTYLRRLSSIQFINDNFLNLDYLDGDIIFVNATCLSYPSWEKLVAKFVNLKSGSRVIVSSKKIENENFEMVQQSLELMSWGMNSVNIYRRK